MVLIAVVGIVLLVPEDGEDDPLPDGPARATSVKAILDVPPRWFRKPVRVTGTAVPIDDTRFVLRDEGVAMVVNPERGVGDIPAGPVTVRGVVSGLDRLQAEALERLLRSGEHPALREAPTELEDAYIAADRVQGG